MPDKRVTIGNQLGGRSVNSKLLVGVFLFVASPVMVAAQQGNLNAVQFEGKGLFKQRCTVCHLATVVGTENGKPVVSTNKTYGPMLSKDMVIPAEAAIREQIMKGSDKMPAFQYGLKPEQITAIIEYLKTVDKQAAKAGSLTNFD
jgi:mono/diheme cytochrome c family protein